MHEIIGFDAVWKHGNSLLLIWWLQFVNEMLPVFIVILYEHLLVAKFELSWLERSSTRPQLDVHFSICTKGGYMERCRLILCLKSEYVLISLSDTYQMNYVWDYRYNNSIKQNREGYKDLWIYLREDKTGLGQVSRLL